MKEGTYDIHGKYRFSLNDALKKYESLDYNGALNELNKIIDSMPKYAPAYNLRGLCKAGLNKFKDSINDYNKAIKLKKDYAAAYMNRGDSKAQLELHKEAFEDYLEVTKIDPTNDTAFDYCGLQKTVLKEYKDSIKFFDKAIQINSKNADYYLSRGISYINLAEINENPELKYEGMASFNWDKAIDLGSDDAKKLNDDYFPSYSSGNIERIKKKRDWIAKNQFDEFYEKFLNNPDRWFKTFSHWKNAKNITAKYSDKKININGDLLIKVSLEYDLKKPGTRKTLSIQKEFPDLDGFKKEGKKEIHLKVCYQLAYLMIILQKNRS